MSGKETDATTNLRKSEVPFPALEVTPECPHSPKGFCSGRTEGGSVPGRYVGGSVVQGAYLHDM